MDLRRVPLYERRFIHGPTADCPVPSTALSGPNLVRAKTYILRDWGNKTRVIADYAPLKLMLAGPYIKPVLRIASTMESDCSIPAERLWRPHIKTLIHRSPICSPSSAPHHSSRVSSRSCPPTPTPRPTSPPLTLGTPVVQWRTSLASNTCTRHTASLQTRTTSPTALALFSRATSSRLAPLPW